MGNAGSPQAGIQRVKDYVCKFIWKNIKYPCKIECANNVIPVVVVFLYAILFHKM